MNSHDYARKMRETADYLLSRPEFETPRVEESIYLGSYWSDKGGFIAAVRALGSGTKKWDGSDLQFDASTPLTLWIRVHRSVMCRKIQEEKWECEPLFSPEEDAAIGVAE